MPEDHPLRSPRVRATIRTAIAAGRETYDRARHLPRLIPVTDAEIADGHGALRKLARALRAERSRGRAGHWSYDLNRHIALRQAYAAERAARRSTRTRNETPAR